jgi:hypothetical protein
MGVWNTGLYSSDFALDLRSAISAVIRLPLDADQLVQALSELEPTASQSMDDEDHTSFWLVLADQFAKRGMRGRELAFKSTQRDRWRVGRKHARKTWNGRFRPSEAPQGTRAGASPRAGQAGVDQVKDRY